MKPLPRLAVYILLLLAGCPVVFGMWASVPLADLVSESDTIVIGTLSDVKTWTEDGMDHGKGTLIVSEIIKGSPKAKELRLVWKNESDIVCPRIEHRHAEGNTFIWLLQTHASEGRVEANYPGKVLDVSERPGVEAELMTVKFKPAPPTNPEDELARLEQVLAKAMTQADMNICSSNISQHLDTRLSRLEDRIAHDLAPDARSLFQKARQVWREYRDAQVAFASDLYRGGSIQPFIYNRTFSRLTKERLDSLRYLDEEGAYRKY